MINAIIGMTIVGVLFYTCIFLIGMASYAVVRAWEFGVKFCEFILK